MSFQHEFTEPIDLTLPAGLSDETIMEQNIERRSLAADMSRFYYLPQLSGIESARVYERLLDAECSMACPNLQVADYENGVATYDDELSVHTGGGRAVVTTEHATNHRRQLKDGSGHTRDADQGTAALGYLLHQELDATHITMLGRQTSDANYDSTHPLKAHLKNAVLEPFAFAHFSLHGVGRSAVRSLMDERSYDILLGVGQEPSEATLEMANAIIRIARDYDLRVGVNQPILRFDPETKRLRRTDEGNPRSITFAAKGEHTTRVFSEKTAQEANKSVAAVQFEISDAYRILAYDARGYTDEATQQWGSYVGYTFLADCTKQLSQLA